jgi:hypothetical protein
MVSGPHSRSGRGGKRKNSQPNRTPVVQPVASLFNILSEIFWPHHLPRFTLNLEPLASVNIRGCIQKFPDWVVTKSTTTINTRWEATQRVMAAKLTRLAHKIAIQLHLVAESCTICSSRTRRPVRRLLDTTSCISRYVLDLSPTQMLSTARHCPDSSLRNMWTLYSNYHPVNRYKAVVPKLWFAKPLGYIF